MEEAYDIPIRVTDSEIEEFYSNKNKVENKINEILSYPDIKEIFEKYIFMPIRDNAIKINSLCNSKIFTSKKDMLETIKKSIKAEILFIAIEENLGKEITEEMLLEILDKDFVINMMITFLEDAANYIDGESINEELSDVDYSKMN